MNTFRLFTRRIPNATYLFVGLVILFSLISPHFLSINNISNILLQGSVLLIISLGITVVMISNGIDLSVGALASLTGMVAGFALSFKWGILPAVLLGVSLGSAAGFFVGILISRLRFPPFIATFGLMGVYQGIALYSNKGKSIYWDPSAFDFIGSGYLLGIGFPIWIAASLFLLVYILLYRTPFGVHVYAIGGNEEGLRLSGVNVAHCKTKIYLFCGLMASIAGLVQASRICSGHPVVGLGYEFEAIASAVVGGTAFFGGQGGIVGTLFGVLVIIVLRNGFNLLGLTTPYQYCAVGTILAVGMTLNTLRYRKGEER